MNKLENAIATIGLNLKETRVFLTLLRLQRATISRLAKELKLPRTSLPPLLEKLERKKTALCVQVGKHYEWEAVRPETLYEQAQEQLTDFKNALPELTTLFGSAQYKKETGPSVLHLHGIRGIQKALDLMLELGREERIYGFEGGRATEGKARALDERYTIRWQSAVRKKGIILEIMASEKLLDVVRAAPLPVLKALKGRAVILTLVPDEQMNFGSDIFAFHDTVVILTPAERSTVVIKDRKAATAFKHLLSFVQASGRKTDLNAFIEKIILEKTANK